jgi:Arc/MetJ-type ribon-helix-helix transcriptional regulator
MSTEKLSLSLPAKTLKFVDAYRKAHSLKSRTDVIEAALALLRETEREEEMSEAPEQDDLEGVDLSDPDARDEESR